MLFHENQLPRGFLKITSEKERKVFSKTPVAESFITHAARRWIGRQFFPTCVISKILLHFPEQLIYRTRVNALSDNPTKYSSTLKQFVGCCRRIV